MNSNMKNITVVPAVGGPPKDMSIAPGTTARDILRELGCDESFILTNGRGAEPFGYDENVYPMVQDGAKLYASTPVEVGSFPQRAVAGVE